MLELSSSKFAKFALANARASARPRVRMRARADDNDDEKERSIRWHEPLAVGQENLGAARIRFGWKADIWNVTQFASLDTRGRIGRTLRATASVQTYDLYSFGANPNIIVGWHKFESQDDKTAIALAAEMLVHGPRELWRADYLVKRWELSD